ncbi:hypothetical protein [Mucilaginibacter phyllosphaerae]|uniref:UDP-N-acetylmuramyl tripeptide synthase n=1 Tax=Mucilaginibacter phyllosphaerae TaxID=1812349 RepID=A0A4Y8AHU5_9SPHI|nr:hypothetical protein [Mucilaginibacter phyllosphaerae]MBB3968525.1 UDP-N-acetylmuramyl tripeptide synthase [Mucilaginibacter phyllosphaerae]TEW67832.1 hypothetical protein E2R65_07545 [Mucilaginibacter phyllosphaerae]GGH15470.1 hypothetical protein GCM10007352_24260 [Mucilaginibacter phyllosphaerae]
MDIALKYKIVEKIIQSSDDYILNQIQTLLNVPEPDFWDDIPENIKKAIGEAKEELDRGEGIAHAQVMADVKSRFQKSNGV